MARFDFHSYLTSKFPGTQTQITIETLQGGFTNLTVRAKFQPPVEYQTHFLRSVVLKYAPPFLASDPSQKLSVNRQIIEAEALRTLGGSGDIPVIAELLQAYTGRVRVPRLIYHDHEQNVLCISDLGKTSTLSEYLASTPPPSEPDVQDLATTVGSFLGKLFVVTGNLTLEVAASLARPHGEEIVDILGVMTRKLLSQAGFDDADVLAVRVEEELRYDKQQEQCIGMGDLWPGSILVDSLGKCGLIDWEYFGLSNAGSEIGMLLAHLHILTIIHQSSEPISLVLRQFISQLLRSFIAESPVPSIYFKRKALITHGRELVNGLDLYSDILNDAVKYTIVQAGVNSLRAAGHGESDIDLSLVKSNGGESIWTDFAMLFCLPNQTSGVVSVGEKSRFRTRDIFLSGKPYVLERSPTASVSSYTLLWLGYFL